MNRGTRYTTFEEFAEAHPEYAGQAAAQLSNAECGMRNAEKRQNQAGENHAREAAKMTRRAPAHVPGVMKQNEAAYQARRLEELRARGIIDGWAFEQTTFELAEGCRYTIDFDITLAGGERGHVEVKGEHCWEDSRIKFKWASSQNPGRLFVWAKWSTKQGTWREEAWRGGQRIKGWKWERR